MNILYLLEFNLSVLNTEDGSVHIDKIVVKFDQHDDSVEHKPGFAHNKLKTTLYQKIRDKRRQELIRKLEEAEKIKKDAEAG